MACWRVATLLPTTSAEGSGDRRWVADPMTRSSGLRATLLPWILRYWRVRAALAGHNIGALFRGLNENGWSQRGIGGAAGMHQSEVSEIIKGRRVLGYRVLVRIADGLGSRAS